MLGASEVADLPPIDQKRVGMCINQAYRECYLPIDGKRPMWAQKRFEISFEKEEAGKELSSEIVSVDKIPELLGEGPLSPMKGPEDEIKARAIFSWDFRALAVGV